MVLGFAVETSNGTDIQKLSAGVKALLGDAAKKLTGHRRRAFMANVAVELPGGSARRAEEHFGWKRHPVELGLHERASGITCVDDLAARGNHRSEARRPALERDIRARADPHRQSAPP